MVTIGIDEVGRGCWAGPLLAAAVVLDMNKPIAGMNDSKKLSRRQRERLNIIIQDEAIAVGIGWVWPAEVDTLGLTESVRLAMHKAVEAIDIVYDEIIIDGNYNFLSDYSKVRTMVAADSLIPAVSAASILAKVARDNYMITKAAYDYPLYGFDKHVGYGTLLHNQALLKYGVTDIHRRSYKPVQRILLRSAQ